MCTSWKIASHANDSDFIFSVPHIQLMKVNAAEDQRTDSVLPICIKICHLNNRTVNHRTCSKFQTLKFDQELIQSITNSTVYFSPTLSAVNPGLVLTAFSC